MSTCVTRALKQVLVLTSEQKANVIYRRERVESTPASRRDPLMMRGKDGAFDVIYKHE